MRIAYLGNFTQSHCTEVHIAATLEDLGHQVIRIQEDPSSLPDFMRKVKESDLFLFTRTWGNLLTLAHLEEMRQAGVPSASFHLDLYVGLQRSILHEGRPLDDVLQSDAFWQTDYVFQPDGDPDSLKYFKDRGVNAIWLKPGVYKPECYIANVPITRDVIFVGSKQYHPEWPYRPKLITWLRDTYGDRFEHWGADGLGTIRNEALNELYASTKVVVGDSLNLGYHHPNYWSDRVYETLGRGGFLIHPAVTGLAGMPHDSKVSDSLKEELEDTTHLLQYDYDDWDMLKYQIDWALTHDKEREVIRRAGHEFVKAHCTYTERMTEMLSIIQQAPNVGEN